MLASLTTSHFALAVAAVAALGVLQTLAMSRATQKVPKGYIQIAESSKPGHGAVHSIGSFPKPRIPTMFEALQKAVKESPNVNFLGHRPFDAHGVALDYVWETYAQVYRRIENFAAGLMHEKLLELTADNERPLSIYMKNRPEWAISQYTAQYCGGFAVAMYDTLGASSTEYILSQTLSPTVVCTSTELPTLFNVKKGVATFKHVIVVDSEAISEVDAASAAEVGLTLYTLYQLEVSGASHPLAPKPSSPSDIHCLIYTSGTTGNPKGVPISHTNMLTSYEGVYESMGQGESAPAFHKGTTHVSYLPLAHVIEQEIHTVIILAQGSIAYYQGNTLKLIEDVALIRPILFFSVPRLLNKIYDKVVHGARAAGGVKAWLFDWALQSKLANLAHGERHHSIFDKLVFSKVEQRLGLDRCRFLGTASAPLSNDVMDFFRVAVSCPVYEVYGQSETGGGATATHITDTIPGSIGLPLSCTEIKLVSVPDMGYNVTDTFHGEGEHRMAVNGRGEIWMRGPNIFSGYYKAPQLTEGAFDDEGWLLSGDIGVWTLDGRLKIVDRKKNIFKLSQGEYVAPEKIENILVTSQYVAQPFVYGDSLHAVLVAIIVPEEAPLVALATTLGVTGTLEQICANDHVVDALLKDLAAVCKKSKLHGFEIPKAIRLHTTPFSVDNDLLTPTFKLKRHEAKKAFMDEIDQLYVKCGDLVAGHNVHQG
ncbi:unnamed protein product [Aphanomyces euteiches]|uniref:AMP-dependent synthetase/ligase domain-containing protein n=1 Tax=Aphanomyces euteiches TaxID=100861 RepID=A0A6G0XND7_9STRA|nr:hypothetical protein Ae201684_003093 [Aphanomyces euteiches]KAH9098663.1 hypothetical protein Ae201684P_017874 [Aphanomyces euteiches]KAH9146719.1 hypothetical protein AeRB84_009422 [Aphanomyces euteiches]